MGNRHTVAFLSSSCSMTLNDIEIVWVNMMGIAMVILMPMMRSMVRSMVRSMMRSMRSMMVVTSSTLSIYVIKIGLEDLTICAIISVVNIAI
jgi:hypothetical protein